MSQKFTSTIAGASIFISVLGLLSRGLGFVREMIFANNFGLETEFDLYLVGAVLPVTINTVLLYVGQNFFVPGFQKVNSSDSEVAHKYYKQSFILFVGAGIIIALLLLLTSDIIINFYMRQAPTSIRLIATDILRIFLWTIPFSAAISIFSALLQTVYEFKYPAISVLFLNISMITLLLLFSHKFGVYIIPVGYAVGTIIQFCYLMIKSQKIIKLNLLKQRSDYIFSKSIISSTLIIIIMIEFISQLYTIFDRYFYGYISPGGIAALNYAFILWTLPITIFSLSIATAVFPTISKAINGSSLDEVERIYNEIISISTFIFMPIAIILFYCGDALIMILFERGKFVEESTAITANVLRIYSISLVFYSIYAVFNKILYSINELNLLFWITIVGLLIKLIFNFLLVDLQQNGLALSTTISFLFFFIACYIVLNIKLRIKNKWLFIQDFIVHLTNSVICLLIINITLELFPAINIIKEFVILTIFVSLYIFNSFIIKHKATLISIGVLKRSQLINKLIAV